MMVLIIKTCTFISDIMECYEFPDICFNGGSCINLQGGYDCRCPNGWIGQNCTTGTSLIIQFLEYDCVSG